MKIQKLSKAAILSCFFVAVDAQAVGICDGTSAAITSPCTQGSQALSAQISSIITTTTPLVGNSQLMTLPDAGYRGGCPAIQACGSPSLGWPNAVGYRQINILPQSGARHGELSLDIDKETFIASGANYGVFFRVNFLGQRELPSFPNGTDGGIELMAHINSAGDLEISAYGAAGDTGSGAPPIYQTLAVAGDAGIRIGVHGYRSSTTSGPHITSYFYVIVDDLVDGRGNGEALVWVNEIPADALQGTTVNVPSSTLRNGASQMAPMNFKYGNLGVSWLSGSGSSMRPVFQFEGLTVRHW